LTFCVLKNYIIALCFLFARSKTACWIRWIRFEKNYRHTSKILRMKVLKWDLRADVIYGRIKMIIFLS